MDDASEQFDVLVGEALDGLPDWVKERLDNVEVILEEEPPAGEPRLLGLYEGIPLTERGQNYYGVLPDRISLYRRTILREAGGSADRLKQVVQDTVVHEIAHFFGISDERLRELGRD
ncbi:MAG: metallopeptidase family protein [Actinomycetota bacterium]